MSTLIMVRHGQARFGSSNYDRLSEMGVSQSDALGNHWVRRGQKLDAVFSGAQKRQTGTLDTVQEAYRKAGLTFPDPEVWEAFNEYDANGIMTRFLPGILEENPGLKESVEIISEKGYGSPEGRKAFQEAFALVMDCWLQGGADVEGIETWEHFKARVVSGIERIRKQYPSGKTVAVFTSGGPVSAILQYALMMPDRVALDLGWIIKNGSLTEFKYKGGRFTLSGFNMTPHFQDDSLVTFR